MVRSLILALFLASSITAHGAYVPGISQVINLGTYPTGSVASKTVSASNVVNQFTLVMSTTSGTNTGYYKFVLMGEQATSGEQYRVTTGTTAYCIPTVAVPSSISFNYGYGTAALASEATTTPPTGVKQYAGTTTGQTLNTLTANVPYPQGIVVKFPSASYPFVFGSAISAVAFSVWMNCEEIAN